MPKLTANRLRKVLSYDRATGIFRRRGGVKAGKVTGTVRSRGPTIICIDNKLYRANRLAWLYVTGKWPKLEIGYINRNTSDTRWVNLREMTPSQRRATARTTNKFGAKGVWITKSGKYGASIIVARKKRYLGVFDTIEKASVAYIRAAKDAFGQFAKARWRTTKADKSLKAVDEFTNSQTRKQQPSGRHRLRPKRLRCVRGRALHRTNIPVARSAIGPQLDVDDYSAWASAYDLQSRVLSDTRASDGGF